MRRIMLRIAYDGTNYVGWQKQPNGLAVEEVVSKAVFELTGENIEIIGASRTDSGVHALGNVAVFDTTSPIPGDKFCYALNRRMPEDIVVQASCEVAEDFHPRHANCVKTYEYRIYNASHPNPLESRYSFFYHGSLNIDKMREAATYLVGEHDFASFCSAGAQVKTTVRTIFSAEIESNEHTIIIRLKGNGFLYNMVRIIAGTLLQVGAGGIEPEELPQIISSCDRSKAGPTAQAKGLTLVGIDYDQMEKNASE